MLRQSRYNCRSLLIIVLLRHFVLIEEIIVKEFRVTIFTVEEMNALKDPQKTPVGRGLMRANCNIETPELPFSAEQVIDLCLI